MDICLNLEDLLNQHVLDQHNATQALSSTILTYAAGLKDMDSPVGVFLFLGPTGVGKTELAKTLNADSFKNKRPLIRLDMSQYNTKWSVTGLIGSGRGYVDSDKGGDLTESLLKEPESVVLLDEVEKADSEVRLTFLPVFDDGHLKNAMGKPVECKKAIFIMTSNLCATEISHLFAKGYSTSEILKQIEPILIEKLSPEFYNRTQPILFRPISAATIEKLISRYIDEVTMKLKARGLELIVGEGIREYLLRNGYNPILGARPLQRLFEREVVGNISSAIVRQKIPSNSLLTLSYSDENGTWNVEWEAL